MGAARKADKVLPIVASEMGRLHACGLSIIPLGAGPDGKAPLRTVANPSLRATLGAMAGAHSQVFGVRLGGLTVLDADQPEYLSVIKERFGQPAVVVATPRGFHAYYEGEIGAGPNLRKEGWPVDIKSGQTSYVVGPWSQRPDGGLYQPEQGVLGITPLVKLREPVRARGNVSCSILDTDVGNRHAALVKVALGMVRCVDSLDELNGNLVFHRDEYLVSPDTFPDAEVHQIASWAWSCRLENRLFAGRDSSFRLDRNGLDRLKGSEDALALWVILQDLHGHRPAVRFPLQREVMVQAGHTQLTRRRFQSAVACLIDRHLLEVAQKHVRGVAPRLYRLMR